MGAGVSCWFLLILLVGYLVVSGGSQGGWINDKWEN